MIANQIIDRCIQELKAITKTDMAVYDTAGICLVATSPEVMVEAGILHSFAGSVADSQTIGELLLMAVRDEDETVYILIAFGTHEIAHMAARVAVAQLRNLMTAYRERYDRNSFFQNLILDNLLLIDIHNRARKLHIEEQVKRLVYLIEIKADKDSGVMETLQSLFSHQSGDHVTSVDEQNIILIKVLKEEETAESPEHTAQMILDMLNAEVMLNARVAYGTVVSELKEVSRSYKEARMALEVGKIFYAERNIAAYNQLGIGRLIYQLPVNLCRMFMEEIFGKTAREGLREAKMYLPDEEILVTVNKFFENSLNISETARQLYIHRNTLVYRIEKLEKATGLDVRNFDDALTFKIALMVVNYLQHLNKNV